MAYKNTLPALHGHSAGSVLSEVMLSLQYS
jgi:hypothetical protein